MTHDGSFRLAIGGQVGVAGGWSIHGDDVRVELRDDLEPTYGLQVQGLIPFAKFLAVGASFAWRSVSIGEAGSERLNVLGIDAVLMGRYAFDLGGIALEPFVSVGIGLGIGVLDEATVSTLNEDSALGVDFALRAGANFWFTRAFGAYLALGYQRDDLFLNDVAVTLTFEQFHIDFGVALRFGSPD